jgi:hypothetical protein
MIAAPVFAPTLYGYHIGRFLNYAKSRAVTQRVAAKQTRLPAF